MSAGSQPISPARFAAALVDLSLPSLHAKAAELRNSIAHLKISNEQLQPHATDGDLDCATAITENNQVMQSMATRISLLKAEVESRGMPWVEDETAEKDPGKDDTNAQNGVARPVSTTGEDVDEEGVHL